MPGGSDGSTGLFLGGCRGRRCGVSQDPGKTSPVRAFPGVNPANSTQSLRGDTHSHQSKERTAPVTQISDLSVIRLKPAGRSKLRMECSTYRFNDCGVPRSMWPPLIQARRRRRETYVTFFHDGGPLVHGGRAVAVDQHHPLQYFSGSIPVLGGELLAPRRSDGRLR